MEEEARLNRKKKEEGTWRKELKRDCGKRWRDGRNGGKFAVFNVIKSVTQLLEIANNILASSGT